MTENPAEMASRDRLEFPVLRDQRDPQENLVLLEILVKMDHQVFPEDPEIKVFTNCIYKFKNTLYILNNNHDLCKIRSHWKSWTTRFTGFARTSRSNRSFWTSWPTG
jgi:hypothetical protein